MQETYSISLAALIEEFSLDVITAPSDPGKIMISNTEVNRPGLALAGFLDIFECSRIQILGVEEHYYLEKQEDARREAKMEEFFRKKPATVIMTTSLVPFPHMAEIAKKYGVPLLVTKEKTSAFIDRKSVV